MALSPLDEVRQRIDRAEALARRVPDDVTLIAISKTQGAAAIEALIAQGQEEFGENRVQEAQAKWASPIEGHPALRASHPDLRLHLVGQLQSNKAEEAVALFDTIHAVDRPSLVAALGKAIAKTGRSPACFLQVNIGDEPQKGGCEVAALPALLETAKAAGLNVVGLMALPPEGAESAPYFALLAKLARRHGLSGLSMGMSADFETAIMCGATHVRVGTALFGEREKGHG
jgi:PLP dependent protein